jgi:NitT/TauT family transport system substrate-binding protein
MGEDMATRRAFVRGAALATGAGLLGLRPHTAAAEPPPETTTIRLHHQPLACFAPIFVAEPLLHAEGFRRVEYVDIPVRLRPIGTRHGAVPEALNAGEIDLAASDPPTYLLSLDAGGSAVLLAGLHAGCVKLLALERIRTVRDLKGKTVAVPSLGRHAFAASIVSYIGLDPRKDIVWTNANAADSMQLFADGVLDAFMGFAPEPDELLARKAGHVLVDTLTDKPWSQYFCCILAGNREFVSKNPVAAKRAIRAILKANEICAADPELAVRALVAQGYKRGQNTALQLMRELPYARWRDYDAEATVRFYALRLREAGMITSTPQKIIAGSTDWRFINELKRELKG